MMLRLKKRQDEKQNTIVQEQPRKTEKQRQNAVVLYMAALFAVVLFIIIMSWFTQQRRNDKTISDLTAQHEQVHIQALENIEALQNRNQELSEKLSGLEKDLEEAQSRADELEKKLAQSEKKAKDDTAAIREHYSREAEETESKYLLLSNLLKLEKSVSAGNKMTAEDAAAGRAAADVIAPLADKLTEDENGLYLRCLEILETAEENLTKEK